MSGQSQWTSGLPVQELGGFPGHCNSGRLERLESLESLEILDSLEILESVEREMSAVKLSLSAVRQILTGQGLQVTVSNCQ